MAQPILEIFETNGTTEITNVDADSHGTVQAGESSTPKEIHIWNNKDGNPNIAVAENLRIHTVTINGLESGDTVENGKEVIEQQMVGIKNLDLNESAYTKIGGSIGKALGSLRGDILGTPSKPTLEAGHSAGGQIEPNTYYGKVTAQDVTGETLASVESDSVTIPAMYSESGENADSETLNTGTNTRIAFKFTSNAIFLNGIMLKMSNGGSLVGNVRIETDNSGSPSGTLAYPYAEKQDVTLSENTLLPIWFDYESIISDSTTYWVVFVVTSGTGTLRGSSSGATNLVKYYDGSWNESVNLQTLVCKVLSYNIINWDWSDVEFADSYNCYRTTSSGTYPDSSKVGDDVEESEIADGLAVPVTGKPPVTATASTAHKIRVERQISVPTSASTGLVSFYYQLRYMYR